MKTCIISIDTFVSPYLQANELRLIRHKEKGTATLVSPGYKEGFQTGFVISDSQEVCQIFYSNLTACLGVYVM